MKRWLFLLTLLPQCTGCLAYGYPTLAYTPALTVPSGGGVQAYRVDVDRTERTAAPTTTQYTLAKIAIDERGNVPSQVELAHATGIYDPFKLASGTEHEKNKYTMLVRLYRPGHRTIEVKEWDKQHDLNWVKARDLNEEERAVDELLRDPAAIHEKYLATGRWEAAAGTPSNWWEQKSLNSPPLGLQSGRNSSNAHRDALRFAASEYDRLSMKANMDVSVRDRMRAKARWLREFADSDAVASVNPGNNPLPTNGLPTFQPMTPPSPPPPPPVWRN